MNIRMRPPGYTHDHLRHALLDNPPLDITVAQKRAAQLAVARHSTSAADCAELLDMLGIGGIE